jgi:hypothetical protein
MDEHVDRVPLGKGDYADFFEVLHDYVAFYVDCGQAGSADQCARVFNRIITTPIGAYNLADVLQRALRQYLERFGAIRNEAGVIVRRADRNE